MSRGNGCRFSRIKTGRQRHSTCGPEVDFTVAFLTVITCSAEHSKHLVTLPVRVGNGKAFICCKDKEMEKEEFYKPEFFMVCTKSRGT